MTWLPSFGLALWALGCAAPEATPDPEVPEPEPEPTVTAKPPTGPPVQFRFESLEGEPLSTESVAGRFTVIGLVATYDVASSAQARFLTGLVKNHVPRINVALLVLEPKSSRPMVEAFVNALRIEYPVAFADAATIAGKGPFEGLHSVPSIVVLDPEGREVWRHLGLTDEAQIDREITRLEGK